MRDRRQRSRAKVAGRATTHVSSTPAGVTWTLAPGASRSRARLRRVSCPTHGVRVEGVPFARHRTEFTRDFEDLVAWLAAKTLLPHDLAGAVVGDQREVVVLLAPRISSMPISKRSFKRLGQGLSQERAQRGPRAAGDGLHRSVSRRRARHQGSRRRPPRRVERHARDRRERGQEVQGGALVADEESRQPHRPPGGHSGTPACSGPTVIDHFTPGVGAIQADRFPP